MKRADLIRELEKKGCVFIRHGGKHDWYQNPKTKVVQPIPRHKELRSDLLPGALRPPAVAGISEVRRLIPARDDGMPLYVQGYAHSVGISGELLEIPEKGKLLDRVKLLNVTQLCLFGNIQISAH